MEEIWKDIIDFEGLYQVSNLGRIKNTRTQYVLKPRFDSDGYHMITLWKGKPTKQYDLKVHRVVGYAFLIIPSPRHNEIDHINNIRHDNRLENIRWANRSMNVRNSAPRGKSGVKGVCFRSNKLNPWQAYVRFNERFKHLGYFATKELAQAARLNFEKEFSYV